MIIDVIRYIYIYVYTRWFFNCMFYIYIYIFVYVFSDHNLGRFHGKDGIFHSPEPRCWDCVFLPWVHGPLEQIYSRLTYIAMENPPF